MSTVKCSCCNSEIIEPIPIRPNEAFLFQYVSSVEYRCSLVPYKMSDTTEYSKIIHMNNVSVATFHQKAGKVD